MGDKIKTLIISILLISVTAISFGYTVNSATLTTTNNSSGNTYYVSNTGNDNNAGTTSSPWKTIQKAVNSVNAGDTIIVKSGTYNERVVIRKSGSSSAWITLKSETKWGAIIDGNHQPPSGTSGATWTGGTLMALDSKYIVIDGFKVINSYHNAIASSRSNYITIQNCYTQNSGHSGIRACYDDTYPVPTNQRVYNIKILYNTIDKAQDGSVSKSQETLTCSEVTNLEIIGNTLLSTCRYEGICTKGDCQNVKIAYNDISVGGVQIYVGNSPKGMADGFYVYNNYVHGNGNPGICISQESPGPGTSKNFYIYNNIMANNGHSIGYISDQPGSYGVTNVNIFNNVLAGSSYGVRITPYSDSMRWKQVTIRNNIFVHGGIYLKSTQPSNELTIDHNCFKGTSSFYGDSAIRADPKLTADYHLQSTSPCINAGSSLGAPNFDYDGYSRSQDNIDIGAFEYGSTKIVEVIEFRPTSDTTTNSNIDTTSDTTETTTSNTYTHTYTKTNTNLNTDTTSDTTETTNSDTTTIVNSNTQTTDNYQESQNNLIQKPTITGKTNGKTGREYEYKFTSTDPQGDKLYYCINWGDGTKEVWVGPYESGTTVSFIHKWTEKGSYIIKVKVMDVHGTESDWTTLKVSIRDSLGRIFWRISERYPLMGNLLNQR